MTFNLHLQFLLLGVVSFPKDVPRLKELGVGGVITLNESYETLVPTSLYNAHDIDRLVIPTRDYLFAPSFFDIDRAVKFIHSNATSGKTTYVHCKVGRGRSTPIGMPFNMGFLWKVLSMFLISGLSYTDGMSSTGASMLLSINKMFDKYDLYGQVAYPKHHMKSDFPDIYSLATRTKGVFINPAFIEPFGLTLIEAAAHGLPMVATKNGGPVDIYTVSVML